MQPSRVLKIKKMQFKNCHFSRSLHAVAHLSSVTLVHPTQPVEILGYVSMPFDTLATH